MPRSWLSAILAVATLTAVACQKTQPSSDGPLLETKPEEWTPGAGLLPQLAESKAIPGNPGFTIHPPKGYRQEPLDVAPGAPVSGARWVSPARPDGTTTKLLVMIGRRPPGEAASPLEQFARDFLASRREVVGPLRRQPVESGNINGLTFGRVRWSAEHPVTKQRTHGFVYVATPGRLDIMLDSQDVEPHHASALELAEASALTFRLAGAAE